MAQFLVPFAAIGPQQTAKEQFTRCFYEKWVYENY